MNNYHDFGVEDWLEDRRFQNWVYNNDSNPFWLHFLETTPHQAGNVEQARSILLSVRGESDAISAQEVKLRVAEILNEVSDDEQDHVTPWWKSKWLLAASVIFVVGIAAGSMKVAGLFTEPEPYYAITENMGREKLVEITNKTDDIKMVNLPDGSSVIMKKNARISYPREFDSDKREVYMIGEVFFEVRKNPKKPFYVYAAEMVTKVTGTSFSIHADESSDQVDLVVKSGLVEVSTFGHDNAGVKVLAGKQLLNPNQMVTLHRISRKLVTKNVKSAALLNLAAETQGFSFKRTKLKDVFSLLEKTYGLHIEYNQATTANCTITAQLGDEPVYEKLEMICAVVNARFEAKGASVKVVSAGCEE